MASIASSTAFAIRSHIESLLSAAFRAYSYALYTAFCSLVVPEILFGSADLAAVGAAFAD